MSGAGFPLGRVVVLGAHILDVLGRPVETIPAGQGMRVAGGDRPRLGRGDHQPEPGTQLPRPG